MSSLRTWFRSSAPSKNRQPSAPVSVSMSTTDTPPKGSVPSSSAAAAHEVNDMEDAMASAALLLNDDMEGAEARLCARKDSSAFHLMGLSVSMFMRSVLGFEKEFMDEANTRLLECEARAWREMKKAEAAALGSSSVWLRRTTSSKDTFTSDAPHPGIYPPGSEYALVHAEAQIMLAIVAELHESLTEAIRGFYKLRKAFVTLSGIIESEEAYLRGGNTFHSRHTSNYPEAGPWSQLGADGRMSYTDDPMPGAFDDKEFAEFEAEKLGEKTAALTKDAVAGKAVDNNVLSKSKSAAAAPSGGVNTLSLNTTRAMQSPSEKRIPPTHIVKTGSPRASSQNARGQTPTVASAINIHKHHLGALTDPIDVFVHTGANLCFGMLLLLISMVPPAFSRLLSIVGFKGDRERGVRMLWQSTKFPNVYGGLAGLMLLSYYNGIVAHSDIMPAEADIAELSKNVDADSSELELVGYPKSRCQMLLVNMRTLYPDSLLWVLEEARLLTSDRRIKEAMALLQSGGSSDGTPKVAKMKQITALTKFELAINAMCAMDWRLMRDSFLACVELNTWSHALYYYNMGCAEVELYRDAVHRFRASKRAGDIAAADTEAAVAAKHKTSAEMHLRKAPTVAGHRTFMARQMPFEAFVVRKLARWEARAKIHNIDLIDAVGVSPALEMAYFWGSAKKLPDDLLELALNKYLPWERCTADALVVAAFQDAPDESGVGSLCKAALLRALGRLGEAQVVLDKELFVHERAAFRGPNKNDYVLAAGHYEAGVILWLQASDPSYFPSGELSVDAYRHQKVNESLAQLERVANWETFVLDARIGMKLRTGLDTVQWLKKKKDWQ
ncbi:Mitochondrial outer membrane protein iml2 [Sporothrix epigloea]|uniref:Inclusion body clearance protein IML2 n=1 Tax=Sporothrix epigloea TaxID=1892477 RepID=A0ABP0DM74_9PEZI